MYKKIYNISILIYPILLILSLVYYKERTVFSDAAYYLFHMICDQGFTIQHYRFGAVFTQLFPLAGIKRGLSLDSIMMLYSAGFAVFYFACYLLCGLVFHDYRTGLLLLLSQVLFISHTFYWIPSELPQGIAFYLTFLAWLNSRPERTMKPALWIWIAICTCFIVFFHPLMIFILSFTLLFFYAERESFAHKKLLLYTAILYVLLFAAKTLLFRTSYDKGSMGGARKLLTTFPHYFLLYSNKTFLLNCLKLYYWIPVCIALIAVVCIRQKKWHVLLLSLAYILGYLLLVNVSYPGPDTPEVYRENMYLPISIFLAFPLVYIVFPAIGSRYATLLAVMASVLLVVRIICLYPAYSGRLQAERMILEKYTDKKIVLKPSPETASALILTWGCPFECWLLSTTENHRTASVIMRENPAELQWAEHKTHTFIYNWGTAGYAELPGRYFIFKDTISGYHIAVE